MVKVTTQHAARQAEKQAETIRSRGNYGDPGENITRTAALWSSYLGIAVEPQDVCALMCLLKVSRLAGDSHHSDSFVDIGGYAVIGSAFCDKS